MMMGDPIPLSVLELEIPVPTIGWHIEMDRRGIAVVSDDIGRQCISRAAARELISEAREAEERKKRQRAEQERRLIEADQQMRAGLWKGLPATAIPEGVSPVAAMAAAIHDERPRRTSLLQETLAGSAMTYHPITEDAGWTVGGGDG